MFYYLSGKIAALEPCLAVIDCSGIGFACNTSMKTVAALKPGENATLYTHCVIREDAFDIYGFISQSELSCFKMLIGISGVGPKAAVSILSSVSPAEFASAVASGDEKMLTAAQGIGKRLAQRIILELKDKLGKEIAAVDVAQIAAAGRSDASGTKAKDVAAALAVLGYTPAEVNAALKKLDLGSLSVEEAVRQVLKTSLR